MHAQRPLVEMLSLLVPSSTHFAFLGQSELAFSPLSLVGSHSMTVVDEQKKKLLI